MLLAYQYQLKVQKSFITHAQNAIMPTVLLLTKAVSLRKKMLLHKGWHREEHYEDTYICMT